MRLLSFASLVMGGGESVGDAFWAGMFGNDHPETQKQQPTQHWGTILTKYCPENYVKTVNVP